MAVLVYNTLENGTVQEEERPHLKDCWTQEATQMRECRKEDECVVSNRFARTYNSEETPV